MALSVWLMDGVCCVLAAKITIKKNQMLGYCMEVGGIFFFCPVCLIERQRLQI